MGNPLRHAFHFLAAAAVTLAAGVVFAQALPVPVNIQPVGPAPGGLSTMVTFDARGVGGASNAGYYTRPVLVSNNTLGGLARGLLRRSLPVAAMAALIEAAGWAIDELTGQVMDSPLDAPEYPNGYFCAIPNGTEKVCGPTREALIGLCCFGNGHYIVSIKPNGNGELENGGSAAISFFPVELPPDPFQHVNYNPQPVPDSQLGQLVRDNPSIWNQALRNADGSVNRNPDVMAEAQRLADALTNPDPITNPAPDPAEEWDSGYQGGDSQNSLDFPTFCDWASVVCSFIDWVKGDDDLGSDVELPVTEIPVTPSTWTSGLSGGACPANRSLNLSVWSGSVSFQPVCDLAGFIRPLVILSALLIGAFIIAGANKQSV